MARIDLTTPLTLRSAFLFPLQNARSRTEVLIGGLVLLIPFVGWLLNMGHRIAIVHSMQAMNEPWPAWRSWHSLLRHGLVTWLGMIYYYAPGGILLLTYRHSASSLVGILAIALIVLATMAVPGYMTHYCKRFDAAEIFNPAKALRRSFEGGRAYWHAWAISFAALLLSLPGLLFFGVGFLFTSVWFWQVAGYSFSHVFTNRFALSDA